MNFVPFGIFPPHYHNDNGSLLNGGLLYFYESGTDDFVLPVYTDHTGTVEVLQPVQLNTRGEPQTEGIYLPDDKVYKIVIKRPNGTTIKTIDGFAPVNGIAGPTGPQGPQGEKGDTGETGPQGEVIYAEEQAPAFAAYIHDIISWSKAGLTVAGEPSPTFRSWYVPSIILGTTSPYIADAQFNRDTRIFTATAAKRWLFSGTASYLNAAALASGTEFAIVLKRGGTGGFYPARPSVTASAVGCASVTCILDLQVGDQVCFACNVPTLFASYVFGGHQISIPISQGTGGESDGKSFTSINDTVSGFLLEKFEAGSNVTLVESNGTVGKKITINAAANTFDGGEIHAPLLLQGTEEVTKTRVSLTNVLELDGNAAIAAILAENGQGEQIIIYCQRQGEGAQGVMDLSNLYYGAEIRFQKVLMKYNPDGNINFIDTFNDPVSDDILKINGKLIATQEYVQNNLNGGYNHTQNTPAMVWTITHNLGYFPSVQTWNSAYDVFSGSVHHVSLNQLTVTFSTEQSGGARVI